MSISVKERLLFFCHIEVVWDSSISSLGCCYSYCYLLLFQAGNYVRDDTVPSLIHMVSNALDLQGYAVQRLFTAVQNDISQVWHAYRTKYSLDTVQSQNLILLGCGTFTFTSYLPDMVHSQIELDIY